MVALLSKPLVLQLLAVQGADGYAGRVPCIYAMHTGKGYLMLEGEYLPHSEEDAWENFQFSLRNATLLLEEQDGCTAKRD